MVTDPIVLPEATVIVACIVFCAWWFSPRQQRKRLRDQARWRAAVRSHFRELVESAGEGTRSAPRPSQIAFRRHDGVLNADDTSLVGAASTGRAQLPHDHEQEGEEMSAYGVATDFGECWRDDLTVACAPISAALGELGRLGVPMPQVRRGDAPVDPPVADALPGCPDEALEWLNAVATAFGEAAARVRRTVGRVQRDAERRFRRGVEGVGDGGGW